ncbi:hypothetical protein AB4559_03785 [Vibrio sp. 10N.222.51.C8]|uniref:hypothetical protein n=1 Tax=unclassified Vibrio TaxID=2614977 RepID=UPI000C84075D|nr:MULTISPECIES: hypothetical protein [unclassified Vibrio]PMN92798.1 hypothetical protein BCT21_20735 [Vibrio sp. 10N.222.55.F9]PMN95381.1 hypothetical protein BCT20_20460 [Vibrio sp. 10N.222.55.C12]PMO21088.1 hypothetical protein BCT17_03975 [Vibrio sp. 10N.222.54.F10]PMO21248.1 hypothetical protein BCT16_07145 [Vibrio sp. 10N.222.54.B6]TKF71565.1 hypothetical protein FCV59_16700 [Vibrio sp. F13]
MTNTFRKTWIIVFSIIAMLMSSYASSSSALMTEVMMMEMGSSKSACYHSDTSVNESMAGCHVMSEEVHAEDSNMSAHALMAQCDMSSMSEDGSSMMGNHCSSVNCCASMCSASPYPIQAVQAVDQLSFSLARFQSVTIGQKVARAQSLLRPPSA